MDLNLLSVVRKTNQAPTQSATQKEGKHVTAGPNETRSKFVKEEPISELSRDLQLKSSKNPEELPMESLMTSLSSAVQLVHPTEQLRLSEEELKHTAEPILLQTGSSQEAEHRFKEMKFNYRKVQLPK